jgi:cytochrome o ubiquinol oxidase subunit II
LNKDFLLNLLNRILSLGIFNDAEVSKAQPKNRFATYALGATVGIVLLSIAIVGIFRHTHAAVLSPDGVIASKEMRLMLIATIAMLSVVIPVFVLTFTFAWRYREDNNKAKYSPRWSHDNLLEAIWWLVPTVIIVALSTITWISSHELEPSKPLVSDKAPITIQVVALQWKWLFLYPDQQVATVNYVRIPTGVPVHFAITADAPMNSFWIPQLGGQIYAMPGMTTQLNLMADQDGTYAGSSANLSGIGFADMRFSTISTSEDDFAAWVTSAKSSSPILDMPLYKAISKPDTKAERATYHLGDTGIFASAEAKFMIPQTTPDPMTGMDMTGMSGMDMSNMKMQ